MRRVLRAVVSALLFAFLGAASADAQIPVMPLDSAAYADSARADSAAADSANAARYAAAREEASEVVPIAPLLGVEGPRPPLTRIVFDRDSLDWLGARTVGDLLALVPGTYVWRGGWTGRPEPVNYDGRGASSVEYFLDGVPYLPIGPDSIGVDAAVLPLGLLDRIEVEPWPGLLRVHLFTSRHDRLAARSRIAAATGDGDLTRYHALLERRFPSGVGFGVAGDYVDAPTLGATSSDARVTNYWVQGSWLPNPRAGLQYQILRSDAERDPFVGVAGLPIGEALIGRRTDQQLRAFLRGGDAGRESSVNLLAGRTSWDDEAADGADQSLTHAGVIAALRRPAWSVSGRGFWRSRWTPLDANAALAVSPATGLTVNVEGTLQLHDDDRSSRWVAARAGSRLGPLLLSVSGRTGQVVAAPSVATSPEQSITDYAGSVAFERSWIGAGASYTHVDAFVPAAFQQFEAVAAPRATAAADWVTFRGRLAPLSWLSAEGWYSTPRDVEPDGTPPAHYVALGTIRTGFRRRYRSGALEVKAQLGVEGWGNGVIGVDAGGAPVLLPSAMHMRMHVQFRLGDFMAYFNRVNLTSELVPYVPGFPIPALGSVFGFRWDFLN